MPPVFAQTAWPAPRATKPVWVNTSDGKRLRLFAWKSGSTTPRGTVFIYQGRTEYTEKYFTTVQCLLERDYNVVTWDWRGQGLSTRAGGNRLIGHVDDFNQFQNDVSAAVVHATALGFGGPKIALAHSMGGLICLRSLHDGHSFERVIFSAPMWAIESSAFVSLFARTVCGIAGLLGKTAYMAPKRNPRNYVINQNPDGNVLTNDKHEFENLRKTLLANPDLETGSPSIHWVNEAMTESKQLLSMPAPQVKALTILGSQERVVDKTAVRNLMSTWPDGQLIEIENAQHELLIEQPQARQKAWDAIDAFLAS